MRHIILAFAFLATMVGCTDPQNKYDLSVSFERDATIVTSRTSGTIKIINKNTVYLLPVVNGLLEQRAKQSLLDSIEDGSLKLELKQVTFTSNDPEDRAAIFCAEKIHTDVSVLEYGHAQDSDSFLHKIEVHFNLDKNCTDPVAQTQKLLRKELLRRIFGTKGQRDAINTKKRNSFKESEENETRQSKSESVAI